MSLRVNPSVWNSIFAVPTTIVDDHIRLASGGQVKVLLYLLRHNNEDVDMEQIADALAISRIDAADAMQYWIETGMVSKDGVAPKEIQVNEKAKTVSSDKLLIELPDVLPTYEQIAARTLESPELKCLFNEAQLRLGKTIGYDTQAKLLMLVDYYGLPVEVILTIIEYCVSQGKSSMSYITKVAKDWGEREINTLEKADEQLKMLSNDKKLWKKFESMFSVDSPKHTEPRFAYLKKWSMEYKQSMELIYFAYEETVNRTNKVEFAYMDKILTSWYQERLKTPQDVLKFKSQRNAAKSQGGQTSQARVKSQTSYDPNKFKEKANAPIEYKRRGTNG